MADYEVYDLGDFALQNGAMLRGCQLAYKSFGKLNAKRDNVIVYPTWYSGQHVDNEWLIGKGMALDPDKYFIVIPNMFGNGLSSSPSNTPEPYNASRFPHVTAYDNVKAQHRLMTEKFGVEKLKLVTGWSMGALQTFHWGAMFPDMVERIAPFCGSAKCSRHNFVFLEGVKAALMADAAFKEGWYDKKPERGLRAMARVYAGWALSQTFYRERAWASAGFSSLEDYLVRAWEGNFLRRDSVNLLSMVDTWANSDISDNEIHNGDLAAALGAIKADTIILPSDTDLYFTITDSENDVAGMPKAELRVISSIWGHRAGNPEFTRDDEAVLAKAVSDLLAR